jgi:hydroxymethylpyrimidine pyrophosphatase-like HAD family hydrolase
VLNLQEPIRVFACDIDGCLAAIDHAPYDLPRLLQVAAYSRASASDPTIPALTLVTGRPHSYVDALMQALDIRLPVSFENGAGLATLHPYRAWLAPAVGDRLGAVREMERIIEAREGLFVQLGKSASLSVFPTDAQRPVASICSELEEILRDQPLDFEIDPSTGCVNLLLPGVDKGSGFIDLCEAMKVPTKAVAGIGDAVGDAPWLARCGLSFAPRNATEDLRAAVDVALDAPDIEATLQAYEALIAANRVLAQRGT